MNWTYKITMAYLKPSFLTTLGRSIIGLAISWVFFLVIFLLLKFFIVKMISDRERMIDVSVISDNIALREDLLFVNAMMFEPDDEFLFNFHHLYDRLSSLPIWENFKMSIGREAPIVYVVHSSPEIKDNLVFNLTGNQDEADWILNITSPSSLDLHRQTFMDDRGDHQYVDWSREGEQISREVFQQINGSSPSVSGKVLTAPFSTQRQVAMLQIIDGFLLLFFILLFAFIFYVFMLSFAGNMLVGWRELRVSGNLLFVLQAKAPLSRFIYMYWASKVTGKFIFLLLSTSVMLFFLPAKIWLLGVIIFILWISLIFYIYLWLLVLMSWVSSDAIKEFTVSLSDKFILLVFVLISGVSLLMMMAQKIVQQMKILSGNEEDLVVAIDQYMFYPSIIENNLTIVAVVLFGALLVLKFSMRWISSRIMLPI